MKKSLLILTLSAAALTAQAEKALIICDGAQAYYTGEMPEATVVVPMGWDAKNDGGTLVCNAGQIKYTSPSSFACRNGAIRWAKGKAATFTPTAGITITKITARSATKDNMSSFGDDWVISEDGLYQTLNVNASTPIEMTPAAQNRMSWFEIEYTGTPSQVLPAIATSFDLVMDREVEVKSATPGATIYYTLDGTEPTTESAVATNGKIALTQDVLLKTLAVKDGMTASYVYQQPIMVPEAGSKIAAMHFPNYKDISYLKDNVVTPVTEDLFIADGTGGNKGWNIGPCLSDQTVETVQFVKDGATLSMAGGGTTPSRYFISATFGNNYELRAYAYTTITINAPEGMLLSDVMFNGADQQANFGLGYSEIVDGANTIVDTTEKEGIGTLTQAAIYSKWNYHYTAPAAGIKTIQFVDKKGTQYFDNFYICYKADPASGIDAVEVDNSNAPVEYYNLQGIRVAADNLGTGIYVKRQGNKAEKIYVK